MDLSIRNVRGIYRADFSPFPKGEMGIGFGFPLLFQYRSPPCCRTRKQVAFKVLNTLLPPHPVTALFPIEEHLPVGKDFIHRPKAITPGLFPFQPLCFAALEPCFMPFLACHNKSIRPLYKCVVGCRLKCFALTHETAWWTCSPPPANPQENSRTPGNYPGVRLQSYTVFLQNVILTRSFLEGNLI